MNASGTRVDQAYESVGVSCFELGDFAILNNVTGDIVLWRKLLQEVRAR